MPQENSSNSALAGQPVPSPQEDLSISAHWQTTPQDNLQNSASAGPSSTRHERICQYLCSGRRRHKRIRRIAGPRVQPPQEDLPNSAQWQTTPRNNSSNSALAGPRIHSPQNDLSTSVHWQATPQEESSHSVLAGPRAHSPPEDLYTSGNGRRRHRRFRRILHWRANASIRNKRMCPLLCRCRRRHKRIRRILFWRTHASTRHKRIFHFCALTDDATTDFVEFCIGLPRRPLATTGFAHFCTMADDATREHLEFQAPALHKKI